LAITSAPGEPASAGGLLQDLIRGDFSKKAIDKDIGVPVRRNQFTTEGNDYDPAFMPNGRIMEPSPFVPCKKPPFC
jgi:hypothetical protein